MVTTKESWIIVVILTAMVIALLGINNIGLVSAQGITAKIGNAKMVLYPELKNGKFETTKTILVINDNDCPVNITLEVSDEIKDIIQINDKNFVLQEGEDKNASFKIILKQPGEYAGRINVYFSKIGEAGGVVLSSTIIIRATGEGSSDNVNGDSNNIKNINLSYIKSIFSGDNKLFIIFIFTTITLFVILVLLIILIKNKKKRRGNVVKLKKLKHE